MKKAFDLIVKNSDIFFFLLVSVYLFFAFLAPFAYLNGFENLGGAIHKVYSRFCHQRVERSLFIFGEKPFYTLEELKRNNYLPKTPDSQYSDIWPEYYGHEYVGNDEIGYKVAICIRDVALYGGLAFGGFFFSFIKRYVCKRCGISIYLLIVLISPMVIDGLFGSVVELLRIESISAVYIDSIVKRIITGSMFGLGLSLLVSSLLSNGESLTISFKKGKMY